MGMMRGMSPAAKEKPALGDFFAKEICSPLQNGLTAKGLADYKARLRGAGASCLERWPSGRRRSPAKGVYWQNRYPEFKSLPLRQILIQLNPG